MYPSNTLRYYIPALLWSLLIAAFSLGPAVQAPTAWQDLLAWDKLGHFVFYGIHVSLICLGYWKNGRKTFGWALLISFLFGFLLEWMQYRFFPGRYFEVLDMVANGLGGLTGLLLFTFFIK